MMEERQTLKMTQTRIVVYGRWSSKDRVKVEMVLEGVDTVGFSISRCPFVCGESEYAGAM